MRKTRETRKTLYRMGDPVVVIAKDQDGVERAYRATVAEKGNTGHISYTGAIRVGTMLFSNLTGLPVDNGHLKDHVVRILPMSDGDPTAYASAARLEEIIDTGPLSKTASVHTKPLRTNHVISKRNAKLIEDRIAAHQARVAREEAELARRMAVVAVSA
jgi:hypothetical protein